MRSRSGSLFAGALLSWGCGAAPTTPTEPALVSESAGISGELGTVLLDLTAACARTCALEDTCLGELPGAESGPSCLDACAAHYSPSRWDDAPSSRICLAAEQREMACFAGLSCEAVQGYFGAYASTQNPCEEADAAAIAACEGLQN